VPPNFIVEFLLFSMDLSLEIFDDFLTLETFFVPPFLDKFEIDVVLFLLTAPLAFRYF
jgi:hypothetical protein